MLGFESLQPSSPACTEPGSSLGSACVLLIRDANCNSCHPCQCSWTSGGLHPPTAASERVLEATRPDSGQACTFPTGTPGRRPCCAIIKAMGSVLAALPEPCSHCPVPPAPAEPDEGALNQAQVSQGRRLLPKKPHRICSPAMFLYVAPAPQSSFAIEQKQIKVISGEAWTCPTGCLGTPWMPMHTVQMLVFTCALALVCSEAGKAQLLSSGPPRASLQSLGTDFPREEAEPQAGSELHEETGELQHHQHQLLLQDSLTEPGLMEIIF